MEKNIFITMSIEDFKNEISQSVQETVNKELHELKNLIKSTDFKFVPRSKLRELLEVTDPTLIKWERDGLLRVYKLGGRMYYQLDQVHQAILNQKQKEEDK